MYKKPDVAVLPSTQQDFVFLGHNGGLGHLLTIPEISMYNIYDPYWLSGTGSYYIYSLLSYADIYAFAGSTNSQCSVFLIHHFLTTTLPYPTITLPLVFIVLRLASEGGSTSSQCSVFIPHHTLTTTLSYPTHHTTPCPYFT